MYMSVAAAKYYLPLIAAKACTAFINHAYALLPCGRLQLARLIVCAAAAVTAGAGVCG